MAKFKSKPTTRSNSDYKASAEDVKDEKQFFKIAIIVTVVLIAVIFMIFSYLS